MEERKLVTLETIKEIKPIEGADAIEVAVVRGWECVVPKADYVVGEAVLFFEIDSFLPVRDEFEFLRKSSYKKLVDGREGFRLKTIKLRGQISQGLVQPVSLLPEDVDLDGDLAAQLGVTKYEPHIPVEISGEARGLIPFPRTDEERVQNINFTPNIYRATEKLDGSSLTVWVWNGELAVASRNYWLKEPKSAHLQALEGAELNPYLVYQGELIGPKIQGNPYKLEKYEFRVFNVLDRGTHRRLPHYEDLASKAGLKVVPYLGEFAVNSPSEALALADGQSVLNNNVKREGIVFRLPLNPEISFKAISNQFLLKDKN